VSAASATVASRLDELAVQLDQATRRINDLTFGHLRPTRASISTMTVTAKLNVRRVCRDSMAIALSLVDGDGPLAAHAHKSHKRKRSSVFFNQITLRHGTKSVKVIFNGSMHVTGCTSPAEFQRVADAVCDFMSEVAGIETSDGTPAVRLCDFDVQMINLNFGAGMQLPLRDLRDRCVEQGYVASYDTDMYPGLNVKVPVDQRRVTVLMFKSGKVIVTGAKTALELETAYGLIAAVLDAHAASAATPPPNPDAT